MKITDIKGGAAVGILSDSWGWAIPKRKEGRSEEEYLAEEYEGGTGLAIDDAERQSREGRREPEAEPQGKEDINQFGGGEDELENENKDWREDFDRDSEDFDGTDGDYDECYEDEEQDEEAEAYMNDYFKKNNIDKDNFKAKEKALKKNKRKDHTKGWKADRKQDKKRIKRDRVQGQRKSFSLGFGRKLDGAGPVTIEWLYLYWRKCLWHPVTRQLCVSINKLARNAIAVGTTGAGYLGLNVVTFMKIHFDTIGACLKLIDSPVLTFVPVKPLLNFILNFPILRVPLKALKKIATVALSYTDLGLVNLASKVNGATNALV